MLLYLSLLCIFDPLSIENEILDYYTDYEIKNAFLIVEKF